MSNILPFHQSIELSTCMRRSSSMDQAISILDKETSSIAIFRPAEDEDYNPLPLPRTPEPRLLSSTGTHSRSTTDSYYSLFSPSEVSVSFRFLNDNSPGIDLIYSSSDLDASGNEEDRPDAKMATVDMRTEPLTNNSPFYTQNGSLESLDGVGTSSSDDLAGRNGGIPLIRASQPSIHFSYGEEEERQLGDSQRSKSLDSLSQMPKNENDSQYHSLDMRRGSNSSNHNNNNIEKLQNYSVLEQLAAEMRQQSRAEDSPLDTTPESEAADTSDLYLTPSPGSTNEYKDSRLLELPAISEENEEASRSRRSSMTHDAALPSDFNHHSIPEPEHIAPGHPRTNSESSQTYHRRVVSDNVVPYNHKPDADFIPSLENPPFPVLIRDAPGRASQTGRCMSQCVLNSQESAPGPTTSERSLSRSDPSLEEKMETDGLDELDEAPKIQAPAPPPVYLTRKNSVVKPNSWQGYMHHGAAIPHSVVTPATAGLLQYSSTRAKVGSSETVKGRGVEKPVKKNSSDSLLGTFFGKRNKSRPKLDSSTFNNGEPSTSNGSQTLPTKGTTHSRPGIPSFSDPADGLPDKFQTLVSPLIPPTQEEEDHVPVDVISALFERYAKYDLFSHHTSKESSHDSWHEKFRHDKMNSKAVKKQDAIYELIDLEKKHCANLAFLQHGYRSRLIEEGILPLADVNKLIPDVIEALLEFHLHLLVRLQARQNESNEVETISDILNQEFAETGMNTIKCIDAYTTFGSMKDRAEKNWVVMLTKNIRFSEFYKKAMANKIYRDFEFRTVMTRIIARPARYGLHCDSILKNENNKFSESFLLTEKAIETTRRFTSRIDNNLLIQHMNKKFDEIRKSFEKDSSTHLFISDKSVQDGYVKIEWNMESICHHMNQEGGRRLFCIGDANVKSHTANKMIPVTIVCFDDIIVFLQKIQGNKERYRFAPIDQPVLSLHALLLRNLAGHSLNIMLIPAVKPALVDIEFTGKNDFNKWMTILEKAIQHAPTKVRLNKKESDDYLRQATVEHEKLERKQKEAEEQWMKQLIDMFERYGIEEVAMFSGFVGKRNDFSLALSTHLDQMPLRGRPDLVERVKDSVRTKFKELRSMKTVPMKKLIDDMTQAKETILWSYLQELEETRDMDSDGSGSDSSGSGRSRPRRIKTFHGATVESTSKPKLGGIRRHTTVPRMGIKEDEEESDDSKREREHAEEKNHSLPLTQSLSSHRECRRLIRDLEKLKTENISLKNELALDKLRITSLEKMRSTSSTVLSDSVETLEILRKKEKDVREDEARRKKNLEEFENDVMEKQQKLESERTQFLLEKEKHKQELKRREEEIANKWTALQGATEAPGLLSRSREPIYMAKSPSHISRESTAMQFPDKLISKTEVKKKK